MLSQFQNHIRQHELFKPTDHILLGVSGGVDSMVMLDLFIKSGYQISIAHCNFSLRDQESDAEQALVERVAQQNGIPTYVRRFETKRVASDNGESIQMAARHLRYDWFEQLCGEHHFDKIAIAHHGDDSTETFFINLLRGTGLRGLTGISSVNGLIVRPLLFANRDQITMYAAQSDVRFLNDSSNTQIKYLRNRLRHDILPRLADSVPAFMETMTDNLSRLEQTQKFVDSQISKIRRRAIHENIIDISIVKQEENINFVMFELLHPYGFTPEVIGDLVRSIDQCGKRFVAPSYIALVDRERIIIQKRERKEITEKLVAMDDAAIEWVDVSDLMSLETASNVALLCVDAAQFPLVIRRWAVGDWFVPLGMRGQKKVSDYLIDAKVPVTEKETQCVLCSAGSDTIMWLIGKRIDDRFKVTENSKLIIKITL